MTPGTRRIWYPGTGSFDGVTSALAARIAVAVTNVAMNRWLDADDDEPLAGVVLDTLDAFRRVAADLLPEPPGTGGPSA